MFCKQFDIKICSNFKVREPSSNMMRMWNALGWIKLHFLMIYFKSNRCISIENHFIAWPCWFLDSTSSYYLHLLCIHICFEHWYSSSHSLKIVNQLKKKNIMIKKTNMRCKTMKIVFIIRWCFFCLLVLYWLICGVSVQMFCEWEHARGKKPKVFFFFYE